MKLTILRETLLKPLQQVIGVVERRQTLPILSNVLVTVSKDSISLTATDLEVELRANMKIDTGVSAEFTLAARKMLDICRTLPEGAKMEIALAEDRVTVKSGRSRFSLSTLPANEFPVVEEVKSAQKFKLVQKDLKQLIDRTHFAMAQQDVRYYLNGLMVELNEGMIRAVATDGHRLALCEMPAAITGATGQQVIVPRKGIQELNRLLSDSDDEAELQIGTNHIRVNLPDIRFTSKLVDGRFPDYQRVLPKGSDKHLVANRESMRHALTRASILSNEKYRGIRWSLGDNLLKIQAHNPEQEEAEEEMEVDYNGAALEIGFNVNYLLDALGAIPVDEVEVSLLDANSSCLIQEPDSKTCQYVVMPMRL
jgi:DNA polymerase-3 subunit beta